MIQLSTQPAPQPQPAAGPGVMAAGSDGTGFLAAFNAAPSDPSAPIVASSGAAAAPDDPELLDPASTVAAGPGALWLGAAMAEAPYVRPPAAPDSPAGDGLAPSAIPATSRSSRPSAGEVVPTGLEVTAAVVRASAAAADHRAPVATGALPVAIPAHPAQGWVVLADQASPEARAVLTRAVTRQRGAGPAPTTTAVPQNPAMTSHRAPAEGWSVQVSAGLPPAPAADGRAAWSLLRATTATRASGHYPMAAVTEPGGSPHDGRTVVPPPASSAPTQAGGVAPATVPVAAQPGPVAAALSVGGDPAQAETPALGIDGADLARGVTAPGAASQSPDAAQEAAAGSSLPPTMVTANRQDAPHRTSPIARNDTPPATFGASAEFAGPTRPDDGPATALAFSPRPPPAADPLAPTGAVVPALAQILTTPLATSVITSAPSFTPHAKPLAATLIEHARNGGTESVELALAPDELGRLRMSMQAEGDVMRVLLSAERPETIDLLRRHADHLAQEFRQAGFSGATLSFGQWGAGGAAHPQAQAQATPPAAPAPVAGPSPTQPTPRAPAVAGVGGLDLRL
ncbi:MAG: hypothetical protein GW902_05490 [Alphaproteobacteria bacterium]|nr:hypothetical protein [Alphaproteobacteria bacterium]